MRLDHIHYRVKNRKNTSEFFSKIFGYKIKKELKNCILLEPPEKPISNMHLLINQYVGPIDGRDIDETKFAQFHCPPEIFVSDGLYGSVIDNWVSKRGGIGGIHRMAYQVENLEKFIQEHKNNKYIKFKKYFSNKVITTTNKLTGIIYEFIQR